MYKYLVLSLFIFRPVFLVISKNYYYALYFFIDSLSIRVDNVLVTALNSVIMHSVITTNLIQ